MIEKIKALCIKYRELIVYVIVGGITTLVSWLAFYLLTYVFDSENSLQLSLNNTLSTFAGILVAYPMNRNWVFQSKNPNIAKEFAGFVSSRLATWLMDLFIMWLCVNVIGLNQFVSKYLISSVLVVVANYIISKLLVFKKS